MSEPLVKKAPQKPQNGVTIKESDITEAFMSGPGQDLVAKLLLQLSRAEGEKNGKTTYPFQTIFGPYKMNSAKARDTDQQRWADYPRQDWSVRQLPTIEAYEAGTDTKQNENGYETGTVRIRVNWPPNFRRSDNSRVTTAFKTAIQNFFRSRYVMDMLDEIYFNERDSKVAGLNELGKNINWSPNVEGLVEDQLVPVTILDVNYRIDLRAWERTLEYENRTKAEPFKETLADLETIVVGYVGVVDVNTAAAEVEIDAVIAVNAEENP